MVFSFLTIFNLKGGIIWSLSANPDSGIPASKYFLRTGMKLSGEKDLSSPLAKEYNLFSADFLTWDSSLEPTQVINSV